MYSIYNILWIIVIKLSFILLYIMYAPSFDEIDYWIDEHNMYMLLCHCLTEIFNKNELNKLIAIFKTFLCIDFRFIWDKIPCRTPKIIPLKKNLIK